MALHFKMHMSIPLLAPSVASGQLGFFLTHQDYCPRPCMCLCVCVGVSLWGLNLIRSIVEADNAMALWISFFCSPYRVRGCSMRVVKCLSIALCACAYVCGQYASLAWQNSPLFNLPQHLVYMLFIAAQFNLWKTERRDGKETRTWKRRKQRITNNCLILKKKRNSFASHFVRYSCPLSQYCKYFIENSMAVTQCM